MFGVSNRGNFPNFLMPEDDDASRVALGSSGVPIPLFRKFRTETTNSGVISAGLN